MQFEKNIMGENWEIFVPGRIDGEAANQLEIEILAAIRQGAKGIYVNLCQSTFLCSAGIRVLLQYWRQMKKNGLTFFVTRPSPEVAAAIEMTGFGEIIEK